MTDLKGYAYPFSIILVLALFIISAGCAKQPQHGIEPADMDLTADPIQDFYQYANGGWLAKNEIPASETRWDIFLELHDRNRQMLRSLLNDLAAGRHRPGSNAQKVADFYRNAMDSTKIENQAGSQLKNYLDKIDRIRNFDDVLKTVARHQMIGTGSLFDVDVLGDLKNSDINAVYVSQGGIGLPDRDYYLESGEKFENYRDEYHSHLKKMLALIGHDPMKTEAAADAVINIETRLAKASKTATELRDLQSWYNKYTFAEASAEMPNIDWAKHFEHLGAPDCEYIIIAQPRFFKEINNMLTDVSIEDWKTYLRWHLVSFAAPYLSSDYVDTNFHFYGTVLYGMKSMKPRWQRVTSITNAKLGEALGRLYVERYFSREAKDRVNELVNNLRIAFHKRIERLEWMSDETKQNAFTKLNKMTQKLGYPDKWLDYSDLDIKDDSYLANIVRANRFEFNRDILKIGEPVDKTEWELTPPTVNAYYHPLNNEVVFPAGILQPPVFDPEADDAVNYGAIGCVIGHEITHGFDDQGSQFDADGNMVNWWTENDRKAFNSRAEVIKRQFDNYVVLDSMKVNGALTLGENIADLGGLAVAYDALQIALEQKGRPGLIDGLNPEQRFFVAWATFWRGKWRDDMLLNLIKTDPHAPNKLRTNGPLSNMPEFFAAFEVPAGAGMRRTDSLLAKVW